jgi:hypothetical protein
MTASLAPAVLGMVERRSSIRSGQKVVRKLESQRQGHSTPMMSGVAPLLPPDEQPYAPRLSGTGSLRREVEALLAASVPSATKEQYRSLILDGNVTSAHSAAMRLRHWKWMKLRYLLDPRYDEFRAFRGAMHRPVDSAGRALVAYLMMARNDRLFREVVLEAIVPMLSQPGSLVGFAPVRLAIEERARDLKWSEQVRRGVTSHLLSSAKDFGVLEGSMTKRTARLRTAPSVTRFAVELGRLEGLSDRRNIDSRWFRLLGVDHDGVLDLMYAAARHGVLTFRFQADVAEIGLPALEDRA